MEDLNAHLAELKKECQGLNISEITNNQKSHNEGVSSKLALKKHELEEVTRSYLNFE